jgi:toxin-antitoxin system PIN domain toxin
MWLCDSNIWLALALSGHVHHQPVRDWLETVTAPASVAFCRATQQSFLRLLTNPAVLRPFGNPPLTNREAWTAYEALLSDYRIAFSETEPPGLERQWRAFTVRDTASAKLWMDGYLAAYALVGGYGLVTTDLAFRQFRHLNLRLLPEGA